MESLSVRCRLLERAVIPRIGDIPSPQAARPGRRMLNDLSAAAGKAGIKGTSELTGVRLRAEIGRDRFSTGGVGCLLILAAMPAPDDAEVIVPFGHFLAGREGQFAADYRTEVAAGRLRPDISASAMLAFLTHYGAPPDQFDEFRRLVREYRARLPAGCGEREAASAILQAA